MHIEKKDFIGNSNNFHWNILKNYDSQKFINLVQKNNISYYEKKLGQLFCNNSSKDILNLLIKEINLNHATSCYSNAVKHISKTGQFFHVKTNREEFISKHCIIASGGLPMPAIGGSDFGLKVAKAFNINIQETQEALVPIINSKYSKLAGISLSTKLKISKSHVIVDDLLFTHKGLSGPIILKATLYKSIHEEFTLDLMPNSSIKDLIKQSPKLTIQNILSKELPNNLSKFILEETNVRDLRANELSKKEINKLEEYIHQHHIKYEKNEGYRKAEVMKGGVCVSELKRSLESRKINGLYFIGETVDVTGLLGGYNFQWAWASAFACANDIIKQKSSS